MTWHDQPSLAFGDPSDVTACARVFADVCTAMTRARPLVLEFNNSGADIWSGTSADELRESMAEIPEQLRRFASANNQVAASLQRFAPELGNYQSQLRSLQSRGSTTTGEINNVERLREMKIDELRAQDGGLEGLISWAYTYSDHPEVASYNSQLDRLQGELERLERQFESNEESFESAVALAVDLIADADTVLYNNGWDKFWTQTLQPILDVVKVVLEIAAIVLVIAALIGSGGTLAPLIVAGLLVAVNVAEIAGTAAAGHEVTGDMWLDLAINVAAFATLGAARYANGLKIASKANKLQADKILKGKTGLTNATKHAAKLKEVERLANSAEKFGKVADNLAKVEGGLGVLEGGIAIGEGNLVGGGIGIVAGGLDIGGIGGAIGDTTRLGHSGVGVGEAIIEGTDTNPEGERQSPKDWPGLDGSGPQ